MAGGTRWGLLRGARIGVLLAVVVGACVFAAPAGAQAVCAATTSGDLVPASLTASPGATLYVGQSTTLLISAGDCGPFGGGPISSSDSIQWLQSSDGGTTWSVVSSGLSLSYAFTPTGAGSTEFEAAISDASGEELTAPVTIPALALPTVANVSVTAPAAATLSLQGTLVPGSSEQWQASSDGGTTWSNDTSDSGATSTTLTVSPTSAAQSGEQFRVVIADPEGSVTTAPATLTVEPVTEPPRIIDQPVSQGPVCVGTTVTFTAVSTGAVTEQWQVSTDGGNTWSNDTADAGNTSQTLTVVVTSDALNGYEYRAFFTSAVYGSAASAAATLSVTPSGPWITTQPANATVSAGGTATFTIGHGGCAAGATVQWSVEPSGASTFTPIAGATSDTLTVANVAPSQGGSQYEATLTLAGVGSVTSSAATLTVDTPPVITTQPSSQVLQCLNSSATFTAAASGFPAPTVQWQVSSSGGSSWSNDTTDAGATTNALTIADPPAAASGNSYRAVYTNAAGSATTNGATLTVDVGPEIVTEPANTTVGAGATATFVVGPAGCLNGATVQWQVSTNGGVTFTTVAGATSDTLTIPAVTVAQSGNEYRAVFTLAGSAVTSNAATLTVVGPPVITTQPVSQAGCGTVTFTVAFTGTPTPTVQWYSEAPGASTFSPISGATSPSLTVTGAAFGTGYEAIVSNAGGSATSNVARILAPPPSQLIGTQPASVTVTAGQPATFTATPASCYSAATVQWQAQAPGATSFTPISGATADTLTIPSTTVAQSGSQYEAVFTIGPLSATTNAATLTVKPSNAPVVSSLTPSSGIPYSVVLISGSNLSGATSVSFGAGHHAFNLTLSSRLIVALAPAGTGTVDVTVTTRNGTSATSSADRFTYR